MKRVGIRQRGIAAVVERLESRVLLSADVLTYHNDNSRTGQDLDETILTPANVNASDFGQLFSYPIDGYAYAQPLYVSNLAIPGKGTHNVVFVATENDSVYAFDADNNSGNNALPLWHDSLADPAAGITPIPAEDTMAEDIAPVVGITGTPVIDATTNTLYVVTNTKDTDFKTGAVSYQQQLHALDITTGAEKFGGPATISFSTPGSGNGSVNGSIAFDPLIELQRSGLALANGSVYITWASHGDNGPYHGFLAAYNASNLQLESVLNFTPDGGGAGIWASGAAPAIDSQGDIFLSTGNGTFDNGNNDWGDSTLEITNTGSLAVIDSFTPFNQADMYNFDIDFGSGGVVLLPMQSGPDPFEAISGAKDGNYYLVNTENLGRYNAVQNSDLQTISVGTAPNGVFSTPAYFNGNLYLDALNTPVESDPVVNGQVEAPTASTPTPFGFPSATPSISANGNSNGIMWAILYGANTILYAYDASNISDELYGSDQGGARDQLGQGVQFAVPTVADGHVFVGTSTSLAVFGLLANSSSVPPTAPSNLAATATAPTTVHLTWQQNSTNAASFLIFRSTADGSATQIGAATGTSASFDDTTAEVGMTYTYTIEAENAAGTSGSSNSATASTPAVAGLVGYWQFDEGTGTSTADASGGDDGTLAGDVTWTSGRIGPSAVEFQGTATDAADVDIPDEPQLRFTASDSFTLGVWVQVAALDGKWTAIVSRSTSATSGYGLYLDPANQWVFASSSTANVIQGPVAQTGWHYLTLVQNGPARTRQLYVDGALAGTGAAGDASGAGDLWVGGSQSMSGEYFNGAVDDLRVYNIDLTAADIQALAKVPATLGPGTGVISGIVFQDDDDSGTQNDGEAGVGGVLVFLDDAGTGQPAPNEPTAVTDASGNYSFSGLADGTYRVTAVPSNEEHLTAPSAGYTDVTLSGGQVVGAIDFGEADKEEAALLSQFSLAMTSKLPATAIAARPGAAVLRVKNTSGVKFNAPLQLTLFLSTSQVLDDTAYSVADPSYQKITLLPNQSRTFELHFTYPADLPAGSYYLIGSVTAEKSIGNDQFIAVSPKSVAVSPPTVALHPAIVNPRGIPVRPGHNAVADVRIQNEGNVDAVGTVTLSLFASTDATLDDTDTPLKTLTKKIRIRPGSFTTFLVGFAAPAGLPAGYYIIAQVTSSTVPADASSTAESTAVPTRLA
jgi:hypothetical protein